MTNHRLALAALATGLALLAGCRGTTPVASTPTAATTPTATATPTAPSAITSTTAGQLRASGTFTAAQVQRVLWSAQGALWVASTTRIDAVAPASGALTKVYETQAPERILAIDPNGIAAVASGTTVRLVQIATGTTLKTLSTGDITNAASFSGPKVLLVAGEAIGASIWEIGSGTKVGTLSGFQTAAPVYNVVLSPDGARDAWVSRATVQFGNANANTLGARLQLEDFAGAYSFAPDGRAFAVSTAVPGAGGALVGRVHLYDAATGTELRRLDGPALFAGLAFAPKEHLLATGGDGFTVWSTDDGKAVGSVTPAEAGKVRHLAFSTDGSTLVTIADDGSGKVWRVAPR